MININLYETALLILLAVIIIILVLYPRYLRRKYIGKPLRLRVGQRFKFNKILETSHGTLIFYANPIFCGVRRSKRIFETSNHMLHAKMNENEYYIASDDESGGIIIKDIKINKT
ncbi:MAG: hypothetical protein US50_C0071G0005 [Candidatus Nomurabacteria bacterium GW2011_GWB1_37_5]|uniref:Uncharacterized protein n=1 Tax=Candidatus Nomurabacteria bacterium GW2011_GWB1_37_5 TaxID=1618742 RepID=A0A0G0JZL7_9BACT|nr:MAG: hypothetical protein US50_C0071G0005 [Candidatus Nomurabacteria bacterium GW2011_GWB1_37_5]